MITVVIVEDQPEHQHHFKIIINNSPLFNCIGIYSNGKDAIEGILNYKPDVVIMDIGLPDISGVECIRQLKASVEEVKFMVCTVFEDDDNIFEALKAGASSYMLKSTKPYRIIDTLLEMHNGEIPISSCIATRLLRYLPQEKEIPEQKDYMITKQEANILSLISKGYSNQQILDIKNINISTMKWYVYSIFIKLREKNHIEAINKYFNN
ncbi:Response regulator protein VraR [compost metagenome]